MSKPKPPRELIPQATVLDWLHEHHPHLHEGAEIDRAWVWLTSNLQGEQNKPIRESLKDYGFVFSRRGGHPLPSGHLGTWGHSCLKPMPFKRRRKSKQVDSGSAGHEVPLPSPGRTRFDPFTDNTETNAEAEAIAFALGQ